jgi:hypothetical protein
VKQVEGITVRTNHVPRDLIDGWELTEKERKEYDHYDWSAIDDGSASATFFRYRGWTYDLDNFERFEKTGEGLSHYWDGHAADSVWSATLIKLVEADYNEKRVIVGRAWW